MLMRPALADPPPPLQQSELWAEALERLGRRVVRSDLDGFGKLISVELPLWRLGAVRMASRGPVWHPNAMPTDRIRALIAHGPRLLNAEQPDAEVLRAAGYRQLATPASIAALRLRETDALQLGQCKGKWRNALRQGRQAGLEIRAFPAKRVWLDWLLDRDAEHQRKARYRGYPAAFTHALVAADPKGSRIWIAGPEDAPLAAILILRHGRAATYHIGWTSPAGRAVCAHHVILMSAAADLAASGCLTFDLGGIDTERAPGLARFKIGAGTEVRPLGGTWLKVPGMAQRDFAC